MSRDNNTFNRYLNPFDVKEGIDNLPDFVPDPHYLQLKTLCNVAFLKICTKTSMVCGIDNINEIIKEYDYLFDETEVWIVLYSAFDNFSFLYLELCELKVFIEDYGDLCSKAIDSFRKTDLKSWIDLNSYLFTYIENRIHFESISNKRNTEIYKYKTFEMMIKASDLTKHLEFYELYKNCIIEY